MDVVDRDPACAGDPVDWLSNAVSRRVGPKLYRGQRRATGPAKTLAVAGELRWGRGVPGVNNELRPASRLKESRSMI